MLFVPIRHLTVNFPCWGVEPIFQEVSIFILYLLFVFILLTFSTESIAYFTQFYPSFSDFTPSAEHSVHL